MITWSCIGRVVSTEDVPLLAVPALEINSRYSSLLGTPSPFFHRSPVLSGAFPVYPEAAIKPLLGIGSSSCYTSYCSSYCSSCVHRAFFPRLTWAVDRAVPGAVGDTGRYPQTLELCFVSPSYRNPFPPSLDSTH